MEKIGISKKNDQYQKIGKVRSVGHQCSKVSRLILDFIVMVFKVVFN